MNNNLIERVRAYHSLSSSDRWEDLQAAILEALSAPVSEEAADVTNEIQTARNICDDHIHGYDYHCYTVLVDALDNAADLLERLDRSESITKSFHDLAVKERDYERIRSNRISDERDLYKRQLDAIDKEINSELFEDGFDDPKINAKSYMAGRVDLIDEIRVIRAMEKK